MFMSGAVVVCVAGFIYGIYMKYQADKKYWKRNIMAATGSDFFPGEPEEDQLRRSNIRMYYLTHPTIPIPPKIKAELDAEDAKCLALLENVVKNIPFYYFKLRRRAKRHLEKWNDRTPIR